MLYQMDEATRQAFRDIARLLEIDEHGSLPGDKCNDETYEAFLAGKYAGCASCAAGMVARAALERRPYILPNYS